MLAEGSGWSGEWMVVRGFPKPVREGGFTEEERDRCKALGASDLGLERQRNWRKLSGKKAHAKKVRQQAEGKPSANGKPRPVWVASLHRTEGARGHWLGSLQGYSARG